jgi:cytochrome c556
MQIAISRLILTSCALALASFAIAGDDPLVARQDLMKSVGKATKPVGQMLRGQADFDAAVVMESLKTYEDVSAEFGELFPVGSESGEETEAAPAIWEDRAGFEEALATWQKSISEALAAKPATLESAKPVLSNVLKSCKGCHDTYRIEND